MPNASMTSIPAAAVPTSAASRWVHRLLALACFTVLGALTGLPDYPAEAAVLGFLVGFAGLLLLTWLLAVFNGAVRKAHGYAKLVGAVYRGFLLLIPFAVLATVSDLGLGWQAAQTFLSAGLIGAGIAVGAEVTRLGGGKLAAGFFPVLWTLALSFLWILLGASILTDGGF